VFSFTKPILGFLTVKNPLYEGFSQGRNLKSRRFSKEIPQTGDFSSEKSLHLGIFLGISQKGNPLHRGFFNKNPLYVGNPTREIPNVHAALMYKV